MISIILYFFLPLIYDFGEFIMVKLTLIGKLVSLKSQQKTKSQNAPTQIGPFSQIIPSFLKAIKFVHRK